MSEYSFKVSLQRLEFVRLFYLCIFLLHLNNTKRCFTTQHMFLVHKVQDG